MALTFTVLGCSGSYPGPGGACGGYLVRSADSTVWLDAGSGTLANLQRHVAISDVDAVVLSHDHPDHWSDIEGFRVACAYVVGHSGVAVFAPATVRPRLTFDPFEAFSWREVADGDVVRVNGLELCFSRTEHPTETLAVRVDGDGRSLAYTADTGPSWSYRSLGAGIHTALSEATYLSDREGTAGHLSGRQAGVLAREAGIPRLVLTHVWPTVDPDDVRAEAEAAYGGPVELARIDETYAV